MRKSEIFAELLKIVAEETEVSAESILSKRKDEETVDARYLLVYLLALHGFSSACISRYIGKDVRCVNYILSNFNVRHRNRKILGIEWEHIRNLVGKSSF